MAVGNKTRELGANAQIEHIACHRPSSACSINFNLRLRTSAVLLSGMFWWWCVLAVVWPCWCYGKGSYLVQKRWGRELPWVGDQAPPQESAVLVIAVISAVDNVERRSAIRDTYLNDVGSHAADIVVKFVVGVPLGGNGALTAPLVADRHHADMLFVPVSDCYENVLLKLLHFMDWVTASIHFSFLMKADDDALLAIPRLASVLRDWPTTRHYRGHFWTGAPHAISPARMQPVRPPIASRTGSNLATLPMHHNSTTAHTLTLHRTAPNLTRPLPSPPPCRHLQGRRSETRRTRTRSPSAPTPCPCCRPTRTAPPTPSLQTWSATSPAGER